MTTSEIVGEAIRKNRHQLGMTQRQVAKVGRAIRQEAVERNVVPARLGLSRGAVRRAEAELVCLARELTNDISASLKFLLEDVIEELTEVSVIHVVVIADGYNPTPLRKRNARYRVALGILGSLTSPPLITIADKKKEEGKAWAATKLLEDMWGLAQSHFSVRGKSIRPVFHYLAGDHGELWDCFQGMGGNGHRSAFCAQKLEGFHLHTCSRLTVLQLHDAGFLCRFATAMDEEACTVTPPLHDTKGLAEVILQHSRQKELIATAILGSAEVSNFTGKQARDMIRLLESMDDPYEQLLAYAFSAVVSFAYRDGNLRHWNGKDSKLFLFGMLSLHVICVLLENRFPGSICGAGAAYIHSLSHSFDRQNVVPLSLSDEAFERENGERKLWLLRGTGGKDRDRERQMLQHELARRKLTEPKEINFDGLFLQYDQIEVCLLCCQHASWGTLADRLTLSGLRKNDDFLMTDNCFTVTCAVSPAAELQALRVCLCSHGSSAAAAADVEPVRKRRPHGQQPRSDPAFVSPHYVSTSEKHKCPHCQTKFGQRTKLEAHLENCTAFLATQSRLDFPKI